MYYLTNQELYHHGILGMKWGIRRFQPYPKGHKGGKEVGEAAKSKTSVREKVKNVVTSEKFKKGVKVTATAAAITAAASLGGAYLASTAGKVAFGKAMTSGPKILNNLYWLTRKPYYYNISGGKLSMKGSDLLKDHSLVPNVDGKLISGSAKSPESFANKLKLDAAYSRSRSFGLYGNEASKDRLPSTSGGINVSSEMITLIDDYVAEKELFNFWPLSV